MPVSKNKRRVAIAGLGTVGTEVFKYLSGHSDFQIIAVSARDKNKNRGLNMSGVAWVDNPCDMGTRDDVDIVIELMGGEGDPAYTLVKTALQYKKNVVTANKALLAKHGSELLALASSQNVSLKFEASVAGGIPVIKLLSEGLSANKIESISGVLNGTCNYILTTMEKTGRGFDDVLSEAQHLGYAEADPTLDVDGGDTAHKIIILAALAYGEFIPMENISVTGIRAITANDILSAKEKGERYKLLATAMRDNITGHITLSVAPTRVPLTSPMAQLDGALNGVMFKTDLAGDIFMSGAGAGGKSTASAVLADAMDLIRKL